MIAVDEIRKYLPKYLSTGAQDDLIRELCTFPDNIDSRMYSMSLKNEESIFQGDGVQDLLVVNFPLTQIRKVPGMILSNTCDVDSDNKRLMEMRVVYAPILNLEKYKTILFAEHVQKGCKTKKSIESHLKDIRKQYISHIFYLPKGGTLRNESIVFLDRLNNCSTSMLTSEQISTQRIFSLSDYGFYLFLFKLSVHFTRIREGVCRTQVPNLAAFSESVRQYGMQTG
jgi:hypothetical protein